LTGHRDRKESTSSPWPRRLVPRIIIVRATHGGVKWKRGHKVVAMNPGLHVYWPLLTDIEIIVTARQTLALPIQVLTTKDQKKVVVGTVVVYKIKDVIHAIGRMNWDVDTTINDITQAAVTSVIAKHSFQEIIDMIGDDKSESTLTDAVRKELRPFGVSVRRCKLVDFADCRVYKIVTNAEGHRSGLPTVQTY
jgi:regulator of protease activity HflC (stomatin/prohibitin superfamily)